jgi:hypothetical protein
MMGNRFDHGGAGPSVRIYTDSGIAIAALERYRVSLHKSGGKKRPFGFLVSAASPSF